jgi:hypothetical protein
MGLAKMEEEGEARRGVKMHDMGLSCVLACGISFTTIESESGGEWGVPSGSIFDG